MKQSPIPKRLIAMVIGDIGIDIQRVFLIPVCTANDVGQLAKGLDFQFSPLGVLRLLRQTAVMAGNITQGSAAQNACGKAIRSTFRLPGRSPLATMSLWARTR